MKSLSERDVEALVDLEQGLWSITSELGILSEIAYEAPISDNVLSFIDEARGLLECAFIDVSNVVRSLVGEETDD